MGGHAVHLAHLLEELTEKGGPLAVIGVVVGAILGLVTHPVMQPGALCESTGIGSNALGVCPDVLDFENVVLILGFAVFCGAVGAVLGLIFTSGKPSE